MLVKKGMENQYRAWLSRRRMESDGQEKIDALHEIAACLENDRRRNFAGEDAVEEALAFEGEKSLQYVVDLVAAITAFHELDDVFRFAWNKKYCGEDWALKRECSDKRYYDPCL